MCSLGTAARLLGEAKRVWWNMISSILTLVSSYHFQALKQLPSEKIQLATKFGITNLGGFQFGVKGTPEYVRQCCEASLKRLDVDYIDLYYQHRVDISVPIEDTVRFIVIFPAFLFLLVY